MKIKRKNTFEFWPPHHHLILVTRGQSPLSLKCWPGPIWELIFCLCQCLPAQARLIIRAQAWRDEGWRDDKTILERLNFPWMGQLKTLSRVSHMGSHRSLLWRNVQSCPLGSATFQKLNTYATDGFRPALWVASRHKADTPCDNTLYPTLHCWPCVSEVPVTTVTTD